MCVLNKLIAHTTDEASIAYVERLVERTISDQPLHIRSMHSRAP